VGARKPRPHERVDDVNVLFFATLREITKQRGIQWAVPTANVGDLLHALCRRYGPEFQKWAFNGDDLSNIVIVLVNGRDVRHEAGMATPLSPDDTVAIFPMVAGG
jgi:molybdopterin synthase sulfur carrier subunit